MLACIGSTHIPPSLVQNRFHKGNNFHSKISAGTKLGVGPGFRWGWWSPMSDMGTFDFSAKTFAKTNEMVEVWKCESCLSLIIAQHATPFITPDEGILLMLKLIEIDYFLWFQIHPNVQCTSFLIIKMMVSIMSMLQTKVGNQQ